MNSRRKILAVLLLVVLAVSLLSVCALAADDGDDVAKSITCTTCNGTGISQGEECGVCEGTGVITSTSRMAFSFWALVPPIVAIILALITKDVYSSLFVGILLLRPLGRDPHQDPRRRHVRHLSARRAHLRR